MSQISASASAADSPRNPPDWRATDITRRAAAPSQLISFAIGDDQYGVDIMAVREIKGWSEITHLPKQPEYVRGLLNLRGVIVATVDLRCRVRPALTQATGLHIAIIAHIAPRRIALPATPLLAIPT